MFSVTETESIRSSTPRLQRDGLRSVAWCHRRHTIIAFPGEDWEKVAMISASVGKVVAPAAVGAAIKAELNRRVRLNPLQ